MIGIDRVHGGNRSDDVLDFSASINPLGPREFHNDGSRE